MRAIVLISLCVGVSSGALGSGPSEPEPSSVTVAELSSWTIADYERRGLPSPAEAWSAEQFETAVSVLKSMSRADLPRTTGSSAPVFARLAEGYGEALTKPGEEAAAGLRVDPRVPSVVGRLLHVYSGRRPDGLLFDAELAALWAVLLRVHAENASKLPSLVVDPPLVDRDDALEIVEGTSKVLRGMLAQHIRLLLVPELRDEVRAQVIADVAALAPELRRSLSDDDRARVIELYESLSLEPALARDAPRLRALARQLAKPPAVDPVE